MRWPGAVEASASPSSRLDQLGTALVDMVSSGELPRHIGTSLLRVAIGLSVGGTAGVLIGAAMALSPVVDKVLGPVYHAVRQVPTLGWIPLLGLWFGYGELPKDLIVIKAAMFPLVLNTYEGLKGVKTAHVDVGRVLTLTPLRLFLKVRLPAALPMILTGLQQALAFSWIACIGVEILFGSGDGIGAMIETGQIEGRMDIVLLGVIFVGLIAFSSPACSPAWPRRACAGAISRSPADDPDQTRVRTRRRRPAAAPWRSAPWARPITSTANRWRCCATSAWTSPPASSSASSAPAAAENRPCCG